jgi:hypothetical protein
MTLVGAAALGITLRAYPVRPQIFSLLAFSILLLLLRRSEEEDARRPLVLVPMVMAAWANLHGGWIVGLGAVALWTAATFALGRWRRGVVLLTTTGAAAAATLVTPYGVDLWRFIASTVGAERPLIGDWLPLYSLPPNFWASWLAGFGMCALVGIKARQRASRPLMLITFGLGAASVRVSRLDAFFALAAAFLVTSAFARETDRVEAPQIGSRAFGWIGSAAALTVAALSLYQARRIEVREQLAPEPQAVRFFLDNGLKGRVLTFFGWGEYAIWHLGRSGLAVSMDGRRETVYSDELVNAHLQYYFSSGNATRYPDALSADYIWLPPDLPVVAALKSAGWPVVFEGPRSVVFGRPGSGITPVRVAEAPTTRDFPGP